MVRTPLSPILSTPIQKRTGRLSRLTGYRLFQASSSPLFRIGCGLALFICCSQKSVVRRGFGPYFSVGSEAGFGQSPFYKNLYFYCYQYVRCIFPVRPNGHKRDWCQKAMQVSTRFGQAREFYKGFQFL